MVSIEFSDDFKKFLDGLSGELRAKAEQETKDFANGLCPLDALDCAEHNSHTKVMLECGVVIFYSIKDDTWYINNGCENKRRAA